LLLFLDYFVRLLAFAPSQVGGMSLPPAAPMVWRPRDEKRALDAAEDDSDYVVQTKLARQVAARRSAKGLRFDVLFGFRFLSFISLFFLFLMTVLGQVSPCTTQPTSSSTARSTPSGIGDTPATTIAYSNN
jgi:hypothetical protein